MSRAIALSVVVVADDMARELPRTLRTLDADYQRDIASGDYEVVVVDNGSAEPVDPGVLSGFQGHARSARVDDAPPSPARAANLGLQLAEGELVGLIVDGARMASPGLLATARLGARLADRPVIATNGWHLGPARHMQAGETGYGAAAEDELLAGVDWQADGYRLFDIATLAGSSGRGVFGPMGESSALFMPSGLWRELGGLDEAFELPGGGLVNHDLYRRACALRGTRLVVVLGEGTFHQYHGGAATSRRLGWDEMHEDYRSRRGEPYRPPPDSPLYVGQVGEHLVAHLDESVRLAVERRARSQSAGGG